jgi:hypothetical protein
MEEVANTSNLQPYALCLMPYASSTSALCLMPYASYALCRMPGAGSEQVQGHQQGP